MSVLDPELQQALDEFEQGLRLKLAELAELAAPVEAAGGGAVHIMPVVIRVAREQGIGIPGLPT